MRGHYAATGWSLDGETQSLCEACVKSMWRLYSVHHFPAVRCISQETVLLKRETNQKLPAIKYHLMFTGENSAVFFGKLVVKFAHALGQQQIARLKTTRTDFFSLLA